MFEVEEKVEKKTKI